MVTQKDVAAHYDAISDHFSATRKGAWTAEYGFYVDNAPVGSSILDLGCGNGRLLWNGLKDVEVDYLGVDISEKLLQKARESLAVTDVECSSVDFLEGSMTKIPADDAQFDRIYCVAAFHHLPTVEERLQALGEMRRTLKADGRLYLSVWNLWQKSLRHHIYKAIWRSLWSDNEFKWNDVFFYWNDKNKRVSPTDLRIFADPGLRYYHAFTVRELKKLLSKSGFALNQVLFPTRDTLNSGRFSGHNIVLECLLKD